VDGSIIPDLPVYEYQSRYQSCFRASEQSMIFLITSETPVERVRLLDQLSSGFLYVVSSPAVTGGSLNVDKERLQYFSRLRELDLRNPLIVGFGVDSYETFQKVTADTDGAIVASAFLRELKGIEEELRGVSREVRSTKLRRATLALVNRIRGGAADVD
jgi:tryptophan synthase alpha chain